MARGVALVRFDAGGDLYCIYCHTTDMVVGRELFDTPELAQATLDARAEAQQGHGTVVEHDEEPADAQATLECVTVYPNWRYDELRFDFPSRASRKHRWLTGPKGLDDVARESSSDGWF